MRLTPWLLLLAPIAPALALEPIPDKLVVLTFDDASRSHVEVAAPLLKRHGFGATFFVTEGFDFPANKRDYMTWEEIARLDRDGNGSAHLWAPGRDAQPWRHLQHGRDRCWR